MSFLMNIRAHTQTPKSSTSNSQNTQSANLKKMISPYTRSFAQTLKTASEKPSINNGNTLQNNQNVNKHDWLIKAARESNEKAEDLAYGYAFDSLNTFPLVDISDSPIIRLSSTGEIVTPKMRAYFHNVSAGMLSQRANLYMSEKNKGTPPALILEKILAFNDALPERFKEMAGW